MTPDDPIAAFLAERRNAVVAGTRADGRPHATPNWFYWDGALFYVSTTRDRVKYRIFTRDPRAQLLVDEPTAFRYLMIYATVDVRTDLAAELPRFRAIREKYSKDVPADDDELLAGLEAERRVLLAIAPDGPPSTWTVRGFG
jgi:PPOX class probable F420-dependent enzyme